MKTVNSERLKIAIRPEVAIPDWSDVTSETACTALEALFKTCNWSERWAGLDAIEDATRSMILKIYARTGHAPSFHDLAQILKMTPDQIEGLISRLAARDMLVLDSGNTAIIGAYPFVERDTEHRVHLTDCALNAMCAIDALGTGAMLNIDVTINSSCRYCGTVIDVQTCDNGTSLGEFTPEQAVVWAGIQYDNNCAAHSLCTVMAFFCSDAHLSAWRTSQNLEPSGYRLSMEEGLQVGKAIFSPLLRDVPH